MKPEKGLLVALVCTFCVLLFQRISGKGINLYNIIVVFSVIYFVSMYVPLRSFFQKDLSTKKENHSDSFKE